MTQNQNPPETIAFSYVKASKPVKLADVQTNVNSVKSAPVKPTKPAKRQNVLEIYNESPLSNVMNWLALFIFVLGSALILFAEVDKSDKLFTMVEDNFAASEVLSDNISVGNRIAMGDLVMPGQSPRTTIAQTPEVEEMDVSEIDLEVQASLDLEAEAGVVAGASDSNMEEEEMPEAEVVEEDLAEVETIAQATEEEESEEKTLEEILAQVQSEEDEALQDILNLNYSEKVAGNTAEFTFDYDEEVMASLNGDTAKQIESPYTVEGLEYGPQLMVFTFMVGDEEAELEVEFMVVPQSPVINNISSTDVSEKGFLTVSGTAVPNSTVKLVIASEIMTADVDVDADGNWVYTTKQALEMGDHTIVAQNVVDGYASDFTDTATFEVTTSAVIADLPETANAGFDVDSTMIALVAAALATGIILAVIWMKVFVVEKEPALVISHVNPGESHINKIKEEVQSKETKKVDKPEKPPKAVKVLDPEKKESPLKMEAEHEVKSFADVPDAEEVNMKDKRERRTKTGVGVSLF